MTLVGDCKFAPGATWFFVRLINGTPDELFCGSIINDRDASSASFCSPTNAAGEAGGGVRVEAFGVPVTAIFDGTYMGKNIHLKTTVTCN